MPTRTLLFLLIVLAAGAGAFGNAGAAEEGDAKALARDFFAQCEVQHQQAREAGTIVVRGDDGFLFLSQELRHLAVGPFWGEHAEGAGRAARPDQRDPLPVIVDYHQQLAERGIELVFVPVPPKAVIYPDKLWPDMPIADGEDGRIPRLDVHHQAFYQKLREQGVKVLDLTEDFLEARAEQEQPPLYCRQDTHWSGRAVELAADRLNELVGRPEWLPESRREFTTETRPVPIRGDLYRDLGDAALERETLELTFIDGGRAPITDRDSPIVLLGDSHLLVFHIGTDMHAIGAGLGDHLAARLGFPLDVVGVRGSGATASRMTLVRRRDNLEGKRMIIWCLSARELTEASAWAPLPAALPPR